MIGIVMAIAPVAIKLFDLFLTKIGAKKEARINFLKTVDSLYGQGIISQKLRENYLKQRQELEGTENETPTPVN